MNKLKLLKGILFLGAIYYFIGAIVHLFGLTIFPFYDGVNMYQPYHDTVIALSALVFSMLFFIVAKDPIKNIDSLNLIIVGLILSILFSLYILWKIDFMAIGSLEKMYQTLVEMTLAIIVVILLFTLKPKNKKR